MIYASLAEVVNGFEYATSWKFIRKGKNDWSLVGLDGDGKVVLEVEHLFYSQLLKLCGQVDSEAPVETVEQPQTIIRRSWIVSALRDCMAALGDGATPAARKKAIGEVCSLLAEMEPKKSDTKEGTREQTQVRGDGGGRPARKDPTDV